MPACIPRAVLEMKAKESAVNEKKKVERDLEDENGGPGVYSDNLNKRSILADGELKEGKMPEILDGHNVVDFIDPDILQRLEELERGEGLRLNPEEQEALAEIRRKKSLLIQQHRIKKSTAESRPIVPRKFDKDKKFTSGRMGKELSDLGLDPTKAINRARTRSLSRGRKRERSLDRGDDDGDVMDVDQANKKLRLRSKPRPKSRSRAPSEIVPGEGFKDSNQKIKALKLAKNAFKKRNKNALKGPGDRTIHNLKPKHLYSGKRSNGKTNRR